MRLTTFFASFVLSVAPSIAATFTVNNTSDVVDATPGDGICETATGNGVCTLRAAVQEAGASTNANTIVVPAGTYSLSATPVCSYSLVTNTNPSAEYMSALCVRGNVTITGAGADSTIIDAGGAAGAPCCGSYPTTRGIVIPLGSVVNISGITIQNGRSNGGYTWFGGGGINNQGTLKISNSVLTANVGVPGGGGIWNDGTLAMDNVDLNANASGGYGGAGLYNDYYGVAEVSHSTFRFGNSQSYGGAIVNLGNLKLLATTAANNIAAGNGGAIYNDSGPLVLTNVTIAANQAFVSGAIWNGNSGTVSANNATLALNHATYHGGGISTGNTFTTRNSIIGGNYNDSNPSAFTDCEGAITSQGHNLISDISTCRVTGATSSDIYGKNPGLAPLGSNGGSTQTLALLSTSPALDAGDPLTPGSGSTSCASADQRGILRPQGSRCDIGAFEQVPSLSVTGILPANAGNSGAVVAVVSGSGIQPGASVRLTRSGQADIAGSSPTVNPGNAELAAAFDLTGAAVGAWDIVVTNPDSSTATLPGSFAIQPAELPQVWSQLVGRNPVRPGQLTTYTVAYGNRGNVEAQAVPLIISVPANFTPVVNVTLAQPPSQSGQAATDWSKVPIYLQPGPENGRYNLGFLIPAIAPHSSGFLQFTLVIPASLQEGNTFALSALTGASFYANGSPDPNTLSQLVDSAIAYAQQSFGVAISASQVPAMTQYAANQLQLAVAAGRQSLVSAMGAQPIVYSLGQLNIDVAQFGAGGFGVFTPRFATQSLNRREVASLRRFAPRSGAAPPTVVCSGTVLAEGQSCNGGGVAPNPGPDPAPCSAVAFFNLVSTGSAGGSCNPSNNNCQTNPGSCQNPNPVTSVDPNAKFGPTGPGAQHYQTGGTAFTYQVLFENEATASAPAQQVVVTDQLDTATLDLSTFSFGPISFGSFTMSPPAGSTQFSGGLDLRPAMNVIARVDASLNASTGLVTWRFASLDPNTEQLTQDALAGFLPPNVTPPQGEGKLMYTISPKPAIASGTTICNQATVVFDTNAPITTQTWCNTVDKTGPVSRVQALPTSESNATFPVQWSGTDSGSGIRDYTIYVSDNGAPYAPWLTQTTDAQGSYAGATGHTYAFYSIARDWVGNVEDSKAAPDTQTLVGSNTPACATDVTGQFRIARSGYRYNTVSQRFQQAITITRTAGGSLAGPFALALEGLSTNAQLYNPAGTTTCIAPGSAYVVLNPGADWNASQSLTITVEFVDPTKTGITYTPAVLAGATR